MNQYRISNELKPNIVNIMNRRVLPYDIRQNIIYTRLDRKYFHQIVLRAKCEYLTKRDNLPPNVHYYVPQVEGFREMEREYGQVAALVPCPRGKK